MAKLLKYDQWLREVEIIVDQQEKVNYWITNYFKNNMIAFKTEHMTAGDYGYRLYGQQEEIIIERKNSLNELSGNLATQDKKERFYNEFNKVKDWTKYLLIENDSLDNLISGAYGTGFSINSYMANLLLLQKRCNLNIHFVNRYNMGLWILKIFYSYYYEKQKE